MATSRAVPAATAPAFMELQIRDLAKTYGNGVRALDRVSLTIPTGMFGLLGPNGAGKSTLMRTLATLQDADAGSAVLKGLPGGDIDVLRDKDAVRRCSATCRRTSASTRRCRRRTCSITSRA
jgi:ABC-type Na+ transport system ATPase subunit NatA